MRIRFVTLVFTGLTAGVSGVITVGQSGGYLASSSAGFLLPAFAAAFLGASAITPGRFNVWGTIIAILFLTTGITGLELLGLSGTSWITQLFYGAALIVAVSVSSIVSRRQGMTR